MRLTRRSFVSLSLSSLGLSATGRASRLLLPQGVATHAVNAQPKSAPSGRPFNAHFTDIAAAARLTAPIIYGNPINNDYIIEATGCGCAFFDYDNDGWMDIFVLSGTRLEGAPEGATNRLYKNNRDGTFADVTEKAGLHDVGWACGVCVGDYNNDGNEDLFITNYLQFDVKRVPKPGENVNCTWKGIPVECGPRGLPRGVHSLYRNNGNGTFTDVSVAAGIVSHRGSYGMTVVAADLDEDGWPDIYVACDSTPSLLFMNNHDG